MFREDLLYLHALRSLPSIGDKSLRLLIGHFGSGQAAWDYKGSYDSVVGLSENARHSLMTRSTLHHPQKLWDFLQTQNIQILHEDDPLYPSLLKETPDHPTLLYTRGNFDFSSLKNFSTIAIVGSRKFTAYGEQVTRRLSNDLARAHLIVVSGLAFGIDKAAHEGTLESNGITLAVLGGSIDDASIAPRSHLKLAQKIMERGALLSEYPPHSAITPGNFPMRNRIIAGLCQGTLVIEAAEQSGSLITATLALDYNRDVFAVPGSIFSPVSTGTHSLIKRGAKLVSNANDIIEELAPLSISVSKKILETDTSQLTENEQKIYKFLSHEPAHLNTLSIESHLSIAETQATLTLLEIYGYAKNIGGTQYIRIQDKH